MRSSPTYYGPKGLKSEALESKGLESNALRSNALKSSLLKLSASSLNARFTPQPSPPSLLSLTTFPQHSLGMDATASEIEILAAVQATVEQYVRISPL